VNADARAEAVTATDCDCCHADIAYQEVCYACPTGEVTEEQREIVRIICGRCYGEGKR
jgi:hypothetical protein